MKDRSLLFQTPEEQKLQITKIDKELENYSRVLSKIRYTLEKEEIAFTCLKNFRHTLKVQLIMLAKERETEL